MDMSFTQSMRADVWAKAFLDVYKNNPSIASDETAMMGWFANAIMCGYDKACSNIFKHPKEI